MRPVEPFEDLTESERQVLVACRAAVKKCARPDWEALRQQAERRFAAKVVDLSPGVASLRHRGWLSCDPATGTYALSHEGARHARDLDWEIGQAEFGAWMTAAERSPAYAEYCRQVYGTDFARFNLVDGEQMTRLLDLTRLTPEHRVVDLGCSVGTMAEYLSDRTGARVTGIDFSVAAIARANERTLGKRDRLSFRVGNLNTLDLSGPRFDVAVSFDTLYFVDDLDAVVGDVLELLEPGGTFLAFYSELCRPGDPPEILEGRSTRLGRALAWRNCEFACEEFTRQELEFWQRVQASMTSLRDTFEAEGHLDLCTTNLDEAKALLEHHARGTVRRYLYQVITHRS
jgi:SAM-dependent methyltransferase